MRTIVFLECSKSGSSRDATEAAEELGFYTVLLTSRPSYLEKRMEFPHVHEMKLVDLENEPAVIEVIHFLQQQGKDIKGVLSFVEPYVYHASVLSRRLGLPTQTSEAIQCIQDKVKMRALFADTGYGVPYQVLSASGDSQPLSLRPPVVVKAPHSTGSKDVLLARSTSEYEDRVQYLHSKYPDEEILVEQYVPGQQYLVEALVHEGQPHVVAVLRQEVAQGERFIITDYCLLAGHGDRVHQIAKDLVADIVARTEFKTGGFHVEFRMNADGCKIIEVNARISGSAMNQMIYHAYGINLVKETIRSTLGETPDLSRSCNQYVYSRYLTVSHKGVLERVTGKQRAKRCPLVKEVYVKPHKGAVLKTPLSMGHRYAYVLTAGPCEEEVRKSAIEAARYISFHFETPLRGERS